jgi:hypothetical protein
MYIPYAFLSGRLLAPSSNMTWLHHVHPQEYLVVAMSKTVHIPTCNGYRESITNSNRSNQLQMPFAKSSCAHHPSGAMAHMGQGPCEAKAHRPIWLQAGALPNGRKTSTEKTFPQKMHVTLKAESCLGGGWDHMPCPCETHRSNRSINIIGLRTTDRGVGMINKSSI